MTKKPTKKELAEQKAADAVEAKELAEQDQARKKRLRRQGLR